MHSADEAGDDAETERKRASRAARSRPRRSSLGSARTRDQSERRTVTAQLTVTPSALERLLSVSGSESNFILVSADGSTTVRVSLAVSSVPDAELRIGSHGAVLDWSRGTLSHRGNRVSLTRMELRLLVALLECAPATAPREQLIAKLWGPDAAQTHERDMALPVWICALRRRFAAIGLPNAIRTVRNIGYAFAGS